MHIADPRVGILFDGWNLLARPWRSPDGASWRIDLHVRRDQVEKDLELRPLDDGSSPALHVSRTARTEYRADVLLEGTRSVRLVLGTLPDGRVLRVELRPVE